MWKRTSDAADALLVGPTLRSEASAQRPRVPGKVRFIPVPFFVVVVVVGGVVVLLLLEEGEEEVVVVVVVFPPSKSLLTD